MSQEEKVTPMAKNKKTDPIPDLEQFKAMIHGCLRCNGTGELCGHCGEASNACTCGGVEEGNLVPCSECENQDDEK